jgi:prepilin-type N-terminal cleavage/methylation domain-containing protein
MCINKSENYISKGFTLIEILVSVAFIALLAGISAPLWVDLQIRNDLDVAQIQLVGQLRRAESLARGNVSDGPWGVKIQAGSFVLFQGPTFAGRTTVSDEIINFPPTIIMSGLSEVIFSKVFSSPSVTGDIIFANRKNETRTTTIGTKGVIFY